MRSFMYTIKVPVGMQVMGYSGWYAQYDGNGSLKPEEGRGWDIGFESEWQGLKLSAAYFQTDYKDKIIDVALGNGHHQFQNSGGTSRLQGIEASGSYDLGQAFSWNFSLMPYVNLTHMIKADDKDGHKLPHIRTNIIAYGLRYDHPAHGLNVDLRLLYLGHQSEKYNDAFYASQTLRTGGETTADLHITKTIWERRDGGRLNVKASLMNIFDKNYMAYYGYPQPGRTFYVGLRYEY